MAKELSLRLNMPLIHLDKEYWLPDWEPSSDEIWRKKVTDLVALEEWIMDGNFGGTFDIRFPRATTLIYLDFPRTLCLYRCIKRSVLTWRQVRSDMGQDCPERFDLQFYSYVWNYQRTQGSRFFELARKYFAGKPVILKSPTAVKNYLNQFQGISSPP